VAHYGSESSTVVENRVDEAAHRIYRVLALAVAAPLFSIIVPTLNVAATLRACLDSVAHQTCRDFELVLVDGGSTDGTPDIANSFTRSLSARLVIHCGTDLGVYDAMNRGVGLATGAWLLFLGADDTLFEADTLARVAAFIGEHQSSDLVYGDVFVRSSSSRWGGVFDLDRLLFEGNIGHQSIFYRREIFAGIGPSNPALVTRYMDIVVARYNDMTGLSTKADKELKKRVPKFIWASSLETFGRKLALLRRKENRQLFTGRIQRFAHAAVDRGRFRTRRAKVP
jgi:glycosyltransferase involved in cell wall biosynthesis